MGMGNGVGVLGDDVRGFDDGRGVKGGKGRGGWWFDLRVREVRL